MGVVALEGGLDFGEDFAAGAEGFLGFVLSVAGLCWSLLFGFGPRAGKVHSFSTTLAGIAPLTLEL